MESRYKRSCRLFKRLCSGSAQITENEINKMMFHILECLGALHEVQSVREKRNLITHAEKAKSTVFFNVLKQISQLNHHGDEDTQAVEILFTAFPDNDKAADERDWLCLHWAAISHDVPNSTILDVFDLDVQAVKRGHNPKSSSNTTPVHLLAATKNPNIHLLKDLVEKIPTIPFLKDYDTDLPLHYATMYGNSTTLIQLLLNWNPSSISAKGFDCAMTPLQCAVLYNDTEARLDIVQTLLDRDRNGVLERDIEQDTPLHNAATRDCHDLVKLLLDVDPCVAKLTNSHGHLPLHKACAQKSEQVLEIVSLLLAAFPQGIFQRDSKGLLPAHIAAQNSTVEVMECIYDSNPDAFAVNVGQYGTPLHRAVLSNDLPKIEYIYRMFPEAAKMKDSNGLLPFDYAMYLGNFEALKTAL